MFAAAAGTSRNGGTVPARSRPGAGIAAVIVSMAPAGRAAAGGARGTWAGG
jgi:hypothetical protein